MLMIKRYRIKHGSFVNTLVLADSRCLSLVNNKFERKLDRRGGRTKLVPARTNARAINRR